MLGYSFGGSLGVRLLILVAFLGAISGLEYLWLRKRATRWRESLFLLACATFGGVLGAAFDQLSMWLSPGYFEHGKGLARGDGFRLEVTLIGFHAGFLAGAASSGLLMVAGRGLPLRRLARAAFWIPVVALACAPFGLLVVSGLTRPSAVPGFREVAGLHYGLYAGALLATAVAAVFVRRAAATSVPEPP